MHYLCFVFMTLAAVGFADDLSSPDKAPQVWVGQNTPGLEVKLDTASKGIVVTLPKKDENPKSIGITLFFKNGNKRRLELKAVDPWQGPGYQALYQAHLTGALSPGNQSFIGFELRIPFRSERPTIIRSEDLRREK